MPSRRALLLVPFLAGALAGCGSVLEDSTRTVRGWMGQDDDAGGRKAPAAACPAPAPSAPLPVPPPMGAPSGECARADDGSRPIPAPVGPPSAVEWPPRAPASGGACPPPAAPIGGGLPGEVTDLAFPRAWSLIVVHHSASRDGGAARFDGWHRAKGWDGVGYDFVIGNGTDTADGALETTYRWREQKGGAHAKGWNEIGIGICLVGNFEESDPTPAQMDTLRILVRHLRGRFAIPRERIVGHGQLLPTKCPGKRFSVAALAAATDPGPAAEERRP